VTPKPGHESRRRVVALVLLVAIVLGGGAAGAWVLLGGDDDGGSSSSARTSTTPTGPTTTGPPPPAECLDALNLVSEGFRLGAVTIAAAESGSQSRQDAAAAETQALAPRLSAASSACRQANPRPECIQALDLASLGFDQVREAIAATTARDMPRADAAAQRLRELASQSREATRKCRGLA
jgi:hypothetical protein